MSPTVSVHDVTKTYGGKVNALRELSFNLHEGRP